MGKGRKGKQPEQSQGGQGGPPAQPQSGNPDGSQGGAQKGPGGPPSGRGRGFPPQQGPGGTNAPVGRGAPPPQQGPGGSNAPMGRGNQPFQQGRGGSNAPMGRGNQPFQKGPGGPNAPMGRGNQPSQQGPGGPSAPMGRGNQPFQQGPGGPQRGAAPPQSQQSPVVQQPKGPTQTPASQPGGGKQPPKKQGDKENKPPPQADSNASQPSKNGSKKLPEHLLLKQIPIPLRKKPGTLGRKTVVEVNQFPLNLKNLCKEIYHYDVAIEPDKPKRLMRPVVAEFAKKHFPSFNPAFDGKKNLYSAKPLPFGTSKTDMIKVINEERVSNNELEFNVTIKLAQKIPTSVVESFIKGQLPEVPQSAIQAIDVVLRAAPLVGAPVPVGRSYFLPPREQVVSLGGGLELWYGFYQSAILNWKPFLNVDVAHKGFPKPNYLDEILQEVCNVQNLNDQLYPDQIRKFKGFVTTLKVDYQIPKVPNSKRTYRINNIGKSAEELKFRPDNGPEISVFQYFQRHKNYTLQFPKLPTVQVDPVAKNIFLPLELCRLKEGQALNRKLDEAQTAVMVKSAAQPPAVRKRRILDAIREARYNRSPVVKEFGIEVNEKLETVEARVLNPPTVQYQNAPNLPTGSGSWRAQRFLDSKSISTWFILNLDFQTRRDKLESFAQMLASQGRQLGMNIDRPKDIQQLDTRRQTVKRDIVSCFESWKKAGAELVVVVIPRVGDFYSTVKKCAELQVGILTQCIKSGTMFKMNPATCGNILLKVNSKINGVNHQLSSNIKPPVLQRPVMLVGMDVTHPSPDQTDIPSVAAVAASHDPKAFQYNMIWRLQDPRREIIEDLQAIIKEQLIFFHKKTNHKPEKIIVYRDGVSEGQFQQVLNYELKAIRDACTSLQADYKPGITFLVVQKRHHVRFFPTRKEDEEGRNRNVQPGTIVDTQITHPRELDFYLVSHASLQGTSRPTKYHRLWDDNNISEDELEVLTFYLCYLFSRCTRSVSYPAPTYYAHLAAFRARVYLENNPAPLNNLRRFAEANKIEPVFMSNTPMFFV